MLALTHIWLAFAGHCDLRGAFTFPLNYNVNGTRVSELSSLSFGPDGALYAMTDNANLFKIKWSFPDGKLDGASIKFESALNLRSSAALDTEGFVVLDNGELLVSTETVDSSEAGILTFFPDGTFKGQAVSVPPMYLQHSHANLGFEALAKLGNSGFITASESNLSIDPVGFLRLLQFNMSTNTLEKSVRYDIEPGWGLVELIALDDIGLQSGSLLALERFWSTQTGSLIRVYFVDTSTATDLAGCTSTECSQATAVRKTLLCDLNNLGIQMDNYEAMAIVPQKTSLIPHNDQFLLLFVNDDNQNPSQIGSQFVLTAVDIASLRQPPSVGFPFGDINVLMLTDVHSWVSGHKRPDHSPMLSADMGDVLSLITHAKSQATALGRDLFVVDNGDIVDGTGVSDATDAHGQALFPLLMQIPYDALNIGNHELYDKRTVSGIVAAGSYAEHFRGKYLTSNVDLAETNQPIGSRTTILTGSQTGRKLVAFGFLYNMLDATTDVVVNKVEDTISQSWFLEALNQDVTGAIVLAHMDLQHELLSLIHQKIRNVRGPTFPIMFVTGHSHYRGFAFFDTHAVSIEAGRFLDTVGFASITLSPQKLQVEHRMITANRDEFSRFVQVPDDQFVTDKGRELKSMIAEVRSQLNLDKVIGCSPKRFFLGEQLWTLFSQQIVPSMLSFDQTTVLMMRKTGLRYDLFEGVVTRDDLLCVSPFQNTFLLLRGLNGSVIRSLFPLLGYTFGMSKSAASLEPSVDYSVVIQNFDQWTIEGGLRTLGVQTHTISNFSTTYTTSSVWTAFVSQNWPCSDSSISTSPLPTVSVIPSTSKSPRDDPSSLSRGQVAAIVITFFMVVAIAAFAIFMFRRGCKGPGLLSHVGGEEGNGNSRSQVGRSAV